MHTCTICMLVYQRLTRLLGSSRMWCLGMCVYGYTYVIPIVYHMGILYDINRIVSYINNIIVMCQYNASFVTTYYDDTYYFMLLVLSPCIMERPSAICCYSFCNIYGFYCTILLLFFYIQILFLLLLFYYTIIFSYPHYILLLCSSYFPSATASNTAYSKTVTNNFLNEQYNNEQSK